MKLYHNACKLRLARNRLATVYLFKYTFGLYASNGSSATGAVDINMYILLVLLMLSERHVMPELNALLFNKKELEEIKQIIETSTFKLQNVYIAIDRGTSTLLTHAIVLRLIKSVAISIIKCA